ncbi:MAG: cytidylate kinase-like family protein [Lachnospiraceae bacterium]|nr:cytidylate kinase-like family protein [Lachnospiraceae bacterium]
MSKGELPVVTISREYGAGGRSIAMGLSEKLEIPWHDRDFIKLTSEKSGYSEEDIDKEGEELSPAERFLDGLLNNVSAYVSSHDAIFKAQKESVLELAKSPCIIVGRCSNIILREAGIPSFDIFLYADKKIRLERAKELLGENCKNPEKYLEERDTLRENYYRKYTGKELGIYRDYNICIDTGKTDYGRIVDFLADIIKDQSV